MATLIESTLRSPRPGLDLYRMTVDEYERLAEAAILDDLPKAFGLAEGELQRKDSPLVPQRVIREAVVNALMHRRK